MYPMRQKDLCDYDPRCIMYSGLMFDKIIIDLTRNNELPHPTEENDSISTQLGKTSFIYTGGHFKIFTEKKELTSV